MHNNNADRLVDPADWFTCMLHMVRVCFTRDQGSAIIFLKVWRARLVSYAALSHFQPTHTHTHMCSARRGRAASACTSSRRAGRRSRGGTPPSSPSSACPPRERYVMFTTSKRRSLSDPAL